MKKNLICYPTRFGNMVHDRRDQCIGRSLMQYGEWAPGETALLNKLLTPSDHVLDIGANVGFHTLFFSRKVGPKGKVLSFEPLEENFRILSLNKIVNNLENVDLFKSLVSDETKVVLKPAFATDIRNLGATSFAEAGASAPSAKPLMQLKIDDMELERCALVKIDVEGMELAVLSGAQNTLATISPILFFEQNSEKNHEEIQKLLRSLGYSCFWAITKAYPKFNIRNNASDIFKGNTESNILAVPKDNVEKYDFLDHLAPVQPGAFNRPPLSELPDSFSIKSNAITRVDVQWANFLSSFFQA